MNAEQFVNRLAELAKKNLDVAKRKNLDYASSEDPFKNFRACERHGISLGQGLMVRMEDKMSRLGNLLQRDAAVNESVMDTALDLANYALILAVWWENEQSVSQDVVDRGDSQHPDRVSSGVSGSTGSISYLGNIRKLRAEPADRGDLHDDFHGS